MNYALKLLDLFDYLLSNLKNPKNFCIVTVLKTNIKNK